MQLQHGISEIKFNFVSLMNKYGGNFIQRNKKSISTSVFRIPFLDIICVTIIKIYQIWYFFEILIILLNNNRNIYSNLIQYVMIAMLQFLGPTNNFILKPTKALMLLKQQFSYFLWKRFHLVDSLIRNWSLQTSTQRIKVVCV